MVEGGGRTRDRDEQMESQMGHVYARGDGLREGKREKTKGKATKRENKSESERSESETETLLPRST